MCDVPIENLSLSSVCSNAPYSRRRWRIDNPNPFGVEVRWIMGWPYEDETVIASAGDFYLFTDTRERWWGNIMKIEWLDEDGGEHYRLRISRGAQCSPRFDLNYDGIVNMVDFAKFALGWLNTACDESNYWCEEADAEPDGDVDWDDLAILAGEWLEEK